VHQRFPLGEREVIGIRVGRGMQVADDGHVRPVIPEPYGVRRLLAGRRGLNEPSGKRFLLVVGRAFIRYRVVTTRPPVTPD
jgi:hypothetical protein